MYRQKSEKALLLATLMVCWYKNNDNFYFDSFGFEPPKELTEYLISPIYYNTEIIQPDGEVICGHLCLFVLSRLSRGERFQKIINDLETHLLKN